MSRLFYAFVKTPFIKTFHKIVKFILKTIIKNDIEFDYTIIKTNDICTYLSYNFGFYNLQDNLRFNYILKYYTSYETGIFDKTKLNDNMMFHNNVYKHLPLRQDPIHHFIEISEELGDRYLLKIVRINMQFPTYPKNKIIKNQYARNIFAKLKLGKVTTKEFEDYNLYMLNNIPSDQHYDIDRTCCQLRWIAY